MATQVSIILRVIPTGVYANPSTAFANANRGFTEGALTTGQTFSLQLGVNFRNGNKGLTLTSGGTELFDFNIGGDAYTYAENGGAGTALTLAYEPDSIFTLAFTQEAGNNIGVSISRTTSELGTSPFLIRRLMEPPDQSTGSSYIVPGRMGAVTVMQTISTPTIFPSRRPLFLSQRRFS